MVLNEHTESGRNRKLNKAKKYKERNGRKMKKSIKQKIVITQMLNFVDTAA